MKLPYPKTPLLSTDTTDLTIGIFPSSTTLGQAGISRIEKAKGMSPLQKDIRGRLIAATLDVVSRVGYNSATTREIADLAGVNEGSIFRCFGSKRRLFDETISSELHSLQQRAELVAHLSSSRGPEAALLFTFQFITDTVVNHRQLVRMLQFGVLEFGDEFGQLLKKHMGGAIGTLAELLGRWVAQDKIGRIDPMSTVISFVASVVSIHEYRALFHGEEHTVPPEVIVTDCMDFWHQALIAMRRSRSAEEGKPDHITS